MTSLAFAPYRQSLRSLDDATLELVTAEKRARLAAIEGRRIALGWSRERLCAGACVNRRTLDKAISGQNLPEEATLRKLSSALLEGERQARRAGGAGAGRGADLAIMFEQACRTAALAFGLEPAAVIAVRPADNRPRDRTWLALVRAKHVAAYALVMTDRVTMTAAAELLGVSKQAVSQAMREVEGRRDDDRDYTARLELVVTR